MIFGYFHKGSGLGNQLHRYVATRVLAEDKGYKWAMIGTENFKGGSFMSPSFGTYEPTTVNWPGMLNIAAWHEKKTVENGVDIRGYDPEINFVEDFTAIDGEFQDERYFEHRLPEIREWLKVEPMYMRPDVCVVGFRGGEYALFSDLYLIEEYWDTAIMIKRSQNPNMRFEVHTDDPVSAEAMLEPLFKKRGIEVKYIHDIGLNWRSVRYAKHLIIANSSFYILPALLNEEVKEVIAPRYWARRSAKNQVWALPQNYYKRFLHI